VVKDEVAPDIGVSRSTRFKLKTPIRYRGRSEFQWHNGVTENLSCTRCTVSHRKVGRTAYADRHAFHSASGHCGADFH